MITKEKKREIVAGLVSMFEGATGFYLLDYTTMTVAETEKLRRELKKKGLSFKVAKNTLILRALKENGTIDVPEKYFAGMSGVVVGYQDPIAPAKVLKELTEKSDKPKLKVAVIENQVFDGSQLKVVAELPTREDMIAGILACIDAPISGIVGSINAVMRDVAYLVEEVAKKREEA